MKTLKIISILIISLSFVISPISFAKPVKLVGTKHVVVGHNGQTSTQKVAAAKLPMKK